MLDFDESVSEDFGGLDLDDEDLRLAKKYSNNNNASKGGKPRAGVRGE